jgi:CheY-like chemotaxis protein
MDKELSTLPRRADPRIMVVDDNTDAADTLGMLLESLACEVTVAYSGAEALASGGSFQPHLVFLDIGMPVMDGCETARRMRTLPWGRQAVIIALTAWSDEATRRRTELAGIDDHLVKPASVQRIREIIGALLP